MLRGSIKNPSAAGLPARRNKTQESADDILKYVQDLFPEEAEHEQSAEIEARENGHDTHASKKSNPPKKSDLPKSDIPKSDIPKKSEPPKKSTLPKSDLPKKSEPLKKSDLPKSDLPKKSEPLKKSDTPKKPRQQNPQPTEPKPSKSNENKNGNKRTAFDIDRDFGDLINSTAHAKLPSKEAMDQILGRRAMHKPPLSDDDIDDDIDDDSDDVAANGDNDSVDEVDDIVCSRSNGSSSREASGSDSAHSDAEVVTSTRHRDHRRAEKTSATSSLFSQSARKAEHRLAASGPRPAARTVLLCDAADPPVRVCYNGTGRLDYWEAHTSFRSHAIKPKTVIIPITNSECVVGSVSGVMPYIKADDAGKDRAPHPRPPPLDCEDARELFGFWDMHPVYYNRLSGMFRRRNFEFGGWEETFAPLSYHGMGAKRIRFVWTKPNAALTPSNSALVLYDNEMSPYVSSMLDYAYITLLSGKTNIGSNANLRDVVRESVTNEKPLVPKISCDGYTETTQDGVSVRERVRADLHTTLCKIYGIKKVYARTRTVAGGFGKTPGKLGYMFSNDPSAQNSAEASLTPLQAVMPSTAEEELNSMSLLRYSGVYGLVVDFTGAALRNVSRKNPEKRKKKEAGADAETGGDEHKSSDTHDAEAATDGKPPKKKSAGVDAAEDNGTGAAAEDDEKKPAKKRARAPSKKSKKKADTPDPSGKHQPEDTHAAASDASDEPKADEAASMDVDSASKHDLTSDEDGEHTQKKTRVAPKKNASKAKAPKK